MSTPTLEATLGLVAALYNGRTDRGGQLKADHVRRVVGYLPPSADGDCKLVAALHDTLEDHRFLTWEILAGLGYPARVVSCVQLITHDPLAETYDSYIARLIRVGSRNLLYVKLADNTDNTCLKRRALLSDADKAWHIDRCERVYYPTRRKLIAAIKDLTGEEFE